MKEMMMNKNKLIDLYTIFLCLFGVVAAALRTVACLTSLDTTIMHFDKKLLINISGWVVVVCIAAFASYLFAQSKEYSPVASSDNGATYIPAGLVAVAMLFMAADRSVSIRHGAYNGQSILKGLAVAVVILAIASAVSFFITVFIGKNESVAKSAFCMALVLFFCMYAAYLYFNRAVHPTNSPIKIVDQLAYLACAVFFLYETRIALGYPQWRPYVATGFAAALLTAYSALPSLIVYLVRGYVLSDSLFETVLSLTLCAYITSRVLLTKRLSSGEQCEAASRIEALAHIREQEIADKYSAARTHTEDNNEENEVVDAENYSFDIPTAEGKEESEEN